MNNTNRMNARGIIIILLLIVGYLILTAPEQSANTATNTGTIVSDVVDRLGVFVDNLTERTANSRPFDRPEPTPAEPTTPGTIHT